jgi:hypothetical protein
VLIKTNRTDPDHLNKTGQYAVNIAFQSADIVRTIPYGS